MEHESNLPFSEQTPLKEDESRSKRRGKILATGFQQEADGTIAPSLPPYKYKRRKNRSRKQVIFSATALSLLLVGALAGAWYTGILKTPSYLGPISHIFDREVTTGVVGEPIEDSSFPSKPVEEHQQESTVVTTPPVAEAGSWEKGVLFEGAWVVPQEVEKKGIKQRSVRVLPLQSGEFLVNIPEEGTLSALDKEGKVLWTKQPEPWGVSGKQRVQRSWDGLVRASDGRAVTFTKGVESAIWWSSAQQPDEERPLPPARTKLPLTISADNYYVNLTWNEQGCDILDSWGTVKGKITFPKTRFSPTAAVPMAQGRLLMANVDGLLYIINKEGLIENKIGPSKAGEKAAIKSLAVDPKGYVFVGAGDRVEIWKSSGEFVFGFTVDGGCASVALSEEGKLYVGDLSGKIKIFSAV
ncbi:hypothetical protein GJ688_02995 [Heliobacillus mobilis]|uniref:Uncharacterized protein n=1 Tax=Heliobacterium mobile TaxID=28064 RepID=A0A6I3SGJ4_HELMO|nr:hypothetical protein [Heliobacterium mobile]MTV47949.1 hypothetical protein [Heliobacterium mobile]